jgi:hypothetical protein
MGIAGVSMSLLETVPIVCPYCGQGVEIVVDCSIEIQEYVEDCHVCCKPINFKISVEDDGELRIEARQEDE